MLPLFRQRRTNFVAPILQARPPQQQLQLRQRRFFAGSWTRTKPQAGARCAPVAWSRSRPASRLPKHAQKTTRPAEIGALFEPDWRAIQVLDTARDTPITWYTNGDINTAFMVLKRHRAPRAVVDSPGFERLIKALHLLAEQGELRPATMSNAFLSLGKLRRFPKGWTGEKMLKPLASQVIAQLDQYDAQQLATIMWGFGELNFAPKVNDVNSLNTMLASVVKQGDIAEPKHILNIARGLANLSVLPTDNTLVKEFVQLATSKRERFNAFEISSFLSSLSRFRYRVEDDVIGLFLETLVAMLDTLKLRDATIALRSLGQLHYLPSDTSQVELLLNRVVEHKDQLNHHDISFALDALANLNSALVTDAALDALFAEAKAKQSSFTLDSAAAVLVSLSKFNRGDADFVNGIASAVAKEPRTLQEEKIAALFASLASHARKGSVVDGAQLTALVGATLPMVQKMRASQMPTIFRALVALNCDTKACAAEIETLTRATVAKAKDLAPKNVCFVLEMMGSLDLKSAELVSDADLGKLIRSTVDHVDQQHAKRMVAALDALGFQPADRTALDKLLAAAGNASDASEAPAA